MNDFSITTDSAVLDRPIDILLQEIDQLFDCNPGDLFGDISHGTDFERFLWDLTIGNNAMAEYIRKLILQKCDTFDFKVSVKVTLHYGTEHDIIIASIDIENDSYFANRTYKI